MRHFRTVLLLSLVAMGCGSATDGQSADPNPIDTVDAGNQDANVSNGGAAGSEHVGTGGTGSGGSAGAGGTVGLGGDAGAGSMGGASQGGTAGVGGEGGSSGVGGEGGSSGQAQGGSSGTSGAGGAGSAAGDGGTGGSTVDPPPPACTFDGFRCNELLFETCVLDGDGVAQYGSTQCGVDSDVGLNCDSETGCYGECSNGDVRCSGETAEACVDGAWATTEECDFQCVNGACEGACTPGNAVCDGASVVTCGEDFRFSNPVACEEDVNATAACSGAGECETACVPGFEDCTAAAGCETDLSSVDSCGDCGIVCPSAANATRTCNGGVCSLTPNACSPGTANCTGDFVCETPTSNDENNCGGCGVKCFGTCSAGVCDVDTVADLASSNANDSVVDLVLDGGHVYWWTYNAGANTILRAPKTGGAPETLTTFSEATIGPRDNALLVDNGQLYWATPSGVFRTLVTGGSVTTLSNQGAASLVIDGGKLYWNSVGTTNLPPCRDRFFGNSPSFLTCNGGAVVTFYTINLSTLAQTSWQTTQYEYSHVLGVQGSEVFVARFNGYFNGNAHYNTSVLTLNATTGAYSRTIVSMARIDGIGTSLGETFGQAVFTGSSMVFTTELGIYDTSTASHDDAAQLQAYGTFASPEFIAVDASHVYLSNQGFSVSRISRSTLATESLFGSPGNAYSKLAVDAGYAYWTVIGTNRSVLRTAK